MALSAGFAINALTGFAAASQDPDRAEIRLQGSIAPRCSVGAMQITRALGDVRRPGKVSLPLNMSCNAPFAYTVTSKNGGLLLANATRAPAPLFAFLPYTVAIKIVTHNGIALDLCSSDHMIAPSATCGTGKVQDTLASLNGTFLDLAWDNKGLLPLAGTFQDQLTVTLSPSF